MIPQIKSATLMLPSNAGNQIDKFSKSIPELAPVSSDNKGNEYEKEASWQVLFFDDKEIIREKIRDYFSGKKVKCHIAATEQEVYKILKDNSPKISLFISDKK